jgi:hypothetical protein
MLLEGNAAVMSLWRLQSRHCSGANESRLYQPRGSGRLGRRCVAGSKERGGRFQCEMPLIPETSRLLVVVANSTIPA